jgi:tetratricopeptide (TPR) repeat protein
MRQLFHPQIFLRLLLIGLLVSFLTLSPRPWLLQASLENAYQAVLNASPAQAAKWLTVVLAFDPWRSDLQLALGRFSARGGDYPTAVAFLEKVDKEQGLSPQDQLILGDVYHALEEDDQAVAAWQAAQEKGADQLSIIQRLLPVHQARLDAAAVTQDFKILADLQLTNPQAQVEAGLRLAASEPLSALPYLERAAALDPKYTLEVQPLRDAILATSRSDDPSLLLVTAGRQLGAQEKWELASQAFQKAVQLRPDFGEAWAYLAESLQQPASQDLRRAREALDQAMRYRPDSVLVNIMASLYWQRQGDDTRAQDYLDKALAIEPENPVLYIQVGDLLARNGDIQEARQAFQKAVDLDPQDVSYRQALVDFLLHHQMDLRESALPVARQAVLFAPKDPAALDLLGQTLFLLGDYHTATRFVERALQIDNTYAPALLHLGVISFFQGDSSKARHRTGDACRSAAAAGVLLPMRAKKKSSQHTERLFQSLQSITGPAAHTEEGDREILRLTSVAGRAVQNVRDTSKILRLKRFRFQLLHQWLVQNLEPCKVADIGGGKGLLSYLLIQSGWEAAVIDPFMQLLPVKYKDVVLGSRVKIPANMKVPYIQAEFQPEMAQTFDLLVGMHAHGCNVKIIDAAAEYGCGFVIFPCCVIDEPFYPPSGVHWLESLADYAVKTGQEVYPFRLNFKSQNIGLFKSGRCKTRNLAPSG